MQLVKSQGIVWSGILWLDVFYYYSCAFHIVLRSTPHLCFSTFNELWNVCNQTELKMSHGSKAEKKQNFFLMIQKQK